MNEDADMPIDVLGESDLPMQFIQSVEEVYTSTAGTDEPQDIDSHFLHMQPSTSSADFTHVTHVASTSSSDYVKMSDIDDEVYELFIAETLRGAVQCRPEVREKLDKMDACGLYGISTEAWDPYMNDYEHLIVHTPSSKCFLSPSMRDICIERIIDQVKVLKNPIGSALHVIQKHFVGFPPVLQLRQKLMEALERQLPGAITDEERREMRMPVRVVTETRRSRWGTGGRGRGRTRPGRGRKRRAEDSPNQSDDIAVGTGSESTNLVEDFSAAELPAVDSLLAQREQNGFVDSNDCGALLEQPAASTAGFPDDATVDDYQPSSSSLDISQPIDDDIYDLLAEVIIGARQLNSVSDDSLRCLLHDASRGHLIAENWQHARDFCPPGWRLILRQNRKIVPRKSEVDAIWSACYTTMSQTHSHNDIYTFLDSKFVGVADCGMLGSSVSQRERDIIRGHRVQFPLPPKTLGLKPMQYIQIDVMVTEGALYGDRYFDQLLIVTDLYSGFAFGRALAENTDQALLVRHLVEIFGPFGPPEAYRTYSCHEELYSVISDAMTSIEQLFKVNIKNIGYANSCSVVLCETVLSRANLELGNRDRWVETLPFAIVEHNHRPAKNFERQLSPFEVMFGRRAWKNSRVAPWIQDAFSPSSSSSLPSNTASMGTSNMTADQLIGSDANGLTKAARPFPPDDFPSIESAKLNWKKVRGQIFPTYQSVFNDYGELIAPCTGMLFLVGDRVFVRNPIYDLSKISKKDGIARVYRGVVVELDLTSGDYPYRIQYWMDDANTVEEMDFETWPSPDDGFDSNFCWFAPWDVVASTCELAKSREVDPSTQPPSSSSSSNPTLLSCLCDSQPSCTAPVSEKCPHQLSAKCCVRLQSSCPHHRKRKAVRAEESSTSEKSNLWDDPLGGNLSMITQKCPATSVKMEVMDPATSRENDDNAGEAGPSTSTNEGISEEKTTCFDKYPARTVETSLDYRFLDGNTGAASSLEADSAEQPAVGNMLPQQRLLYMPASPMLRFVEGLGTVSHQPMIPLSRRFVPTNNIVVTKAPVVGSVACRQRAAANHRRRVTILSSLPSDASPTTLNTHPAGSRVNRITGRRFMPNYAATPFISDRMQSAEVPTHPSLQFDDVLSNYEALANDQL